MNAREKPIFALVEDHRHKLMKWFTERREKDVNTEGILVSKAAQQIKAALNRAQRYSLLKSNDFIYEVFSPETIRIDIVRLDTKTCTCFEWQLSCLPYSHALAVNLELQQDLQGYAKEFYCLDAYHRTYENAIFPPNVNAAQVGLQLPITGLQDNHYGVHLPPLHPPVVNRQPGRPKNKRIRGATEGEDRAKIVFHCGNCNKTGHSSRTCPDPPREA